MAQQYVNGRWVTVVDTIDENSALPNRPTPTEVNSTSSGNEDGSGDSSDKEYEEESYDIVSGSISVTKADMGVKCRGAVNLSGLGEVFGGTYYVTGVRITLNSATMKQTIDVHRDSLGKKVVKPPEPPRLEPVLPPPPPPRTYTVKAGDCLWNIAKKELGNATRWTEIYQLNKDKIKSNYIIYVGQVLTLPS